MKKWLSVLGMITCMFAFTACGQQDKDTVEYLSEENALSMAENYASVINQVVVLEQQEDYVAMMEQEGQDGSVLSSAFSSWEAALEDMGDYVGVVKVASNSLTTKEIQGTIYPDDGVVTVEIQGNTRNAMLEIVFENRQLSSVSTNVVYTFGEKMEKAALNTLLGMGTVFIVLILISGIISCFRLIPKVQAMFSKKSAKEEVSSKAVDNTIAQIIEKEELSDDLELVAVISAAIAASEGASSTDGFVVRSIRRTSGRWQKA